MPQTRVAEIMTTELVTLMEADNLATIAADFDAYAFRHLPVVDGKKLVGIVSERDLLRASASELDSSKAAGERARHLQDAFVHAVMHVAPETVTEDTTVAEAASRLVTKKVGCLPVVREDGTLVGLVTAYDLLRHLAKVEG